MPSFELSLPIRLPSPNVQEHWTKRSKRNKTHYLLLRRSFGEMATDIATPCCFKLIRKGKRLLDGDNLIFAFKGIRDSLCMIVTGKKRGVGDDDPGFTWEYAQEISSKYSVHVEVTW